MIEVYEANELFRRLSVEMVAVRGESADGALYAIFTALIDRIEALEKTTEALERPADDGGK